MLTLFVALMLMGAVADRAWGGWAIFKTPDRGFGKTVFLLIAPICYFLLHLSLPLSVGLALAFMIGRSPAWKVFGGSLAPYPHEYAATLGRHAINSVALIMVGLVYAQGFEPSFGWAALYPPVALLGAIWIRKASDRVDDDGAPDGVDISGFVEVVRGAVWGLTAALMLSPLGVVTQG